MGKKIISVLLLFSLLVVSINFNVVYGLTTSGLYTYRNLEDGTIEITAYSGSEKNVIVPATIDGYKVTSVRVHAFIDNSKIESVTFSEGLEIVDSYVFVNCTNLTTVTFPSTVIKIHDLFYKTCSKLKNINIPAGMTRAESGEYLKLDNVTITGTYNYDIANEIVEVTNEYRKSKNLTELKIDKELMEAAMKRASELAIYYNHYRPNSLDCFTVLESKVSKENIYAATLNADGSEIVTAWKNSSMHNAAMLEANHRSIGVGHFKINGTTYSVQLFSDNESTDTTRKTGSYEKSTQIGVSTLMNAISLKINGFDEEITLKMGETIQPTSVMNCNTKFNNRKVYLQASELQWSSSDENIFTVNKEGKITAVNPGTATLTVKLSNETKTYTINVTAQGVGMSLDKHQYQLDNTQNTVQLNAKLSTGATSKATWKSSNSEIATVDSNGLVTAKKGGFVYISAQNAFGRDECWIYVCMLRPLSDGSRVYPGDLNGDGVINSIDATMIGDWNNRPYLTEDEIAIGDFDGNGAVNSNDAAIVQDLYNSDTNFKPGRYKPITSISLNKAQATLQEGGNIQLIATTTPSLAETTDVPQIIWKSSNPYVARVDENGNVTHVSGGTTIITATASNGLKATCEITSEGEVRYRSITGTVTSFTDSSKENKNVIIELLERETVVKAVKVTGNEANYRIEGVTEGKYTLRVSKENHVTRKYNITVGKEDITQDVKIHLKGDVTGDGKVNMQDALQVTAHAKNKKELKNYEYECANIDGNGKINMQDALQVTAHAKNKKALW